MNAKLLAAVLALAPLAPLAGQSPDPSASPAAAASPTISGEFELKLDNIPHEVSEGQPFEIKLATGEKVTGLLTRRRTRQFKGEGVSMEYASDFKLTSEKDGDLVTLTLDHPRSPVAMVQVFPAEVKPDDVPKELLDGIRKEFKEKGATTVKEPHAVQREFKAGKRAGQAIQYKIGGQQIEVEIYSWSQAGRTLALTLQWATEEVELAKEVFGPFASSIDAAP